MAQSKATLTLLVVYDMDSLPETSDLQEVIDKCREVGEVKSAIYVVPEPITKDLIKEGF